MLTSLIRFVFISILFSSTAVFSADNASISTELSALQVTPQNTSNTQLPEWFYRELTSIRKDVSVLDATGASKEQIQELKERIGNLEVRLEESQLRVDGKLNEQSGRIGDLKDSYDSSLSQVSWTTTWFGIVAGILGIVIAIVAYAFSWNARLAAIATAKLEAEKLTAEWIGHKEKSISNKFDMQIQGLNLRFNDELKTIKEIASFQSIEIKLSRAINLYTPDQSVHALRDFDEIINLCSGSKKTTYLQLASQALFYKGSLLEKLNRKEEALLVYSQLVEQFKENEDETISAFVIFAGHMRDSLIKGDE